MRTLAKKAVLDSGVLRLAAGVLEARTAILMFHSVREHPSAAADLLGGIVHSSSVFRGQMELLARDFHPLNLDSVLSDLRQGRSLSRRSVVVTFDDGYADNHETAMAILNSVGVPATFYVTVDSLEKSRLPWPGRLRFPFRTTKLRHWRDSSGKSWSLEGDGARERAYAAACAICCRLTGSDQDGFIACVEKDLQATVPDEANRYMMSYDQAKDLIRHGHIVGSHTMTHPNMAHIPREKAHVELSESKRRLEFQLGASVMHFSYPCPALSPHWSDDTVRESGRVGYQSAVTTDWGLVREGDNPLRLKRLLPTKTVEGLRWNLECAFAGRAV